MVVAPIIDVINKDNFEYIGADANSDFITHCRSKHPNATFYNEIVEDNFHKADIICASGVFNRRFDESIKIIHSFISSAQNSTAKLTVVNFLHTSALKKYSHNFYTSLGDVEAVIDRNLTNGFEIDGLSLPGEFTIGLYK